LKPLLIRNLLPRWLESLGPVSLSWRVGASQMTQLTPETYGIWSIKMRVLLQGAGLWPYVVAKTESVAKDGTADNRRQERSLRQLLVMKSSVDWHLRTSRTGESFGRLLLILSGRREEESSLPFIDRNRRCDSIRTKKTWKFFSHDTRRSSRISEQLESRKRKI
jgi:hypothetical protein